MGNKSRRFRIMRGQKRQIALNSEAVREFERIHGEYIPPSNPGPQTDSPQREKEEYTPPNGHYDSLNISQ